MAATGYTPIQLYYSATGSAVPLAANLAAGELAINTNDGKLYYKDSSNAVQVIGTKGGVGSSTTTQVLYNSSGLVVGSSNMTFNGTVLTSTGFAGPIGATSTSTGAFTAVTSPSLTNAGTLALSATGANYMTASTNGTERLRITSNGGISFGASGTAYGSSGQILQSNGDAAPTWVANTGISTGKSIAMALIFGF